ncbi:PAS domain S-box protein [Methanoculleus sp. FWC-SCC1]|uniref:histidine kinase n=1 Tax=Methanoculleus frigidifontis TaxID=2584085 RepID=A0ABT8M8I2_9EURY|nr:PAS domain S-box protein [Methanoculleus sp. FWC-SCC1]MDN7024235.1 PAS domain S-box protein [Methanoculleus sp. FWC-SCC1]
MRFIAGWYHSMKSPSLLSPELLSASAVLDALSEGALLIDQNNRVLLVNRTLERLLGIDRDAVCGSDADQFVRRYLDEACTERITQQESTDTACTIRPAYGREQQVLITTSVMQDEPFRSMRLVRFRESPGQKRADEGVRQSETLQRSVAANFPGAIYVFDHDLLFVVAAGQALGQIGWSRESLEGRRVQDLDEETARILEPRYRRVLAGETLEFETPYHGRTFLSRYVPVTSDRGTVELGMVIALDITGRKQAEDALRESGERLRAVLENSLDAAYRRNLVTDRYDYMSPVIEQILGFTPEEMGAMDIDEVLNRIHPDDRAPAEEEIAHAIAAGQGTLEYRFRTKDGEYRWLADHFTVTRDAEGRPLFRGGVVRDITRRKQVEETLRESQERLALALDAAHLAPWTIDLITGTVAPSEALAELFGVSDPGALQTRAGWRACVLEEDRPRIQPAIEEAVASGGEYRVEFRIRRPADGAVRWIASQGLVSRDKLGRAHRLIGVAADVTESKSAEEERARLYTDLENAHREANLYLDILTHDMGNATNVPGIYADLLIEELDGPEKEHARRLKAGIDRSTEILRNVATIRKIYEGRAPLEPIDVDRAIRAGIAHLQHIRIHCRNIHREVCADALLPEVFANLIGNAVKYGGPDVRVTVRAREQNGEVLISVEDTGPGVPDEVKGKLFTRFERGMAKGKGQGLGLFIVRTLVERYGGRVWVDDRVRGRPEAGAAFRFTLRKAA